ncbi:MAG TPA: HigA family addiction module antitoxin [Candidatus Kapabacteria bacterium]|nr:HigA family addiction module antitoxin [Candidatus Kapabacteria bacterium]
MALLRNIKPHLILGPGEYIKELMETLNWKQEDLASVIGISLKHLNSIVQNKQPITFEVAKLLSKAFGHSTQFWINLDTDYKLKLSKLSKEESDVEIRTILYKFMPISEMMKRGWINKTKEATILLDSIKEFWENDTVDEAFFQSLYSSFALRKSDVFDSFNLYYALTWLQMAKSYSQTFKVPEFNKPQLEILSNNLHNYTTSKNGVEDFLKELEKVGVKFLLLKHLPKTYIDGATFFDNSNPVVVYTSRFNRIDHFWFTIAHELGHILKHLQPGSTGFIDDAELNKERNKIENEADEFASLILKHKDIFNFFNEDIKYITKAQIQECSEILNIHQGIIIGALAHKKTISYAHLHKFTEEINSKIPLRYFVEQGKL